MYCKDAAKSQEKMLFRTMSPADTFLFMRLIATVSPPFNPQIVCINSISQEPFVVNKIPLCAGEQKNVDSILLSWYNNLITTKD